MISFRDDSALVGREREQNHLRSLLERAIAGDGALVLISGEAGIGKTTLVDDLARRAEAAGALVLAGGCYDLMTTPPYGPWIETLNGYVPNGEMLPLPGGLRNADELRDLGSQAALFAEAYRFFAALAAAQPVLLVLEDLHWSDPGSLQLLRSLARQLLDQPVLIVITYRDDEVTHDHALFSLIPALVREAAAERIELQPLDETAVHALLTSLELSASDESRLVTYLLQRGEGNPLFTHELLRVLQADGILRSHNATMTLGDLESVRVPSLVVQVIEQRLTDLDHSAREALQTAAVIGQVALLQLWRMAVEIDDPAFDACLEAAFDLTILEETPDRQAVQFTHALVLETLYESIVPTRRQMQHRRIGELVADLPHPDPDVVAQHFQRAGDERALSWLVRAGLRAWQSFAWISAANRFEQAASMLANDPSHTSQRGWLLYLTGTLLRYDDIRKALECFDEAERLGMLAADEALVANCRWHRGISFCHRGDLDEGLSELRQGVEVLDRLADQRYLSLPGERNADVLAV